MFLVGFYTACCYVVTHNGKEGIDAVMERMLYIAGIMEMSD